ncbi:MAG: sugar kinase [Chloroflexi bacterium]|uniref:sugar kinase n=1 Tax=Candidatus Flexifilum breve TaxID=3140694 RepID=UPI003135C519|nr:sugar kinase [Chloroflexota bacterium]
MALELLTFGEALVEIMRTALDVPLDTPGEFTGPYPSGAPFIFAVQAARLGMRVGALGCVGAQADGQLDAFGRNLVDQLEADGVDTSAVIALPSYTTGCAFVAYSSDGSRDFVFHLRHAAAGQLSPALLDQPAVQNLFSGLKCLHIMGSSLSMHADALVLGTRMLELAQAQGAKISFDPNLRPQLIAPAQAKIAFAPFAAAADVIMPTAEEAALLTGESTVAAAAGKLLVGKPDGVVIITRGEHGCTVYTPAGHTDVPGFAVAEIDPTGAGDCFDAGFLAEWLRGKSPIDAARWANACGALAVTQRGPMAGAASAAQVQAFIETAQERL